MSEENVEVGERNYEEDARKQGWVPQEEYKGNKEAWLEAKDFVIRGEQINPILRSTNERIKFELAKTQKELEEVRQAAEDFKKFQKESFEKKKEALENEIKELREQKKQAISAGDGELAVELDDKIDRLREEKSSVKEEVKEAKKDSIDPEIQREIEEWIERNHWYKSNVRMAAATNAIAEDLRKEKPYLVGKVFFEELDKALEDNFSPERLGRKAKVKTMVEGSSGSGTRPSSNKKTYENLPADAKAACDKFVKAKLMTKEQYIADYQWDY